MQAYDMNQGPPVTTQSAAQLETPNESQANCRHFLVTLMANRMQILVLVSLHLGFSTQSRFG